MPAPHTLPCVAMVKPGVFSTTMLVEESLPGAPQDRARTNLYAGETPRGTPATTYGQELAMQTCKVPAVTATIDI